MKIKTAKIISGSTDSRGDYMSSLFVDDKFVYKGWGNIDRDLVYTIYFKMGVKLKFV